jgi:N-glycosylase/DNA lyase
MDYSGFESGAIDLRDIAGPFDLQATLESGQSYLWNRADSGMYDSMSVSGGSNWYETVAPPIDGISDTPIVIRVRQREDQLEWEATGDPVEVLTHLLRLDDDLTSIYDSFPDDELVTTAVDAFHGLRLVRDPPFSTLISFICSAQMRVSRIHQMQLSMADAFGTTHTVGGESFAAFPTSSQLAAQSESALRDLSLGYRAPYVQRTAEMVSTGEAHPAIAAERAYEDAREYLTQFVGVGNKVADCVLLFSLDYTSRAIRDRLGGQYAGYAQTYVFYYLRGGGEVSSADTANL